MTPNDMGALEFIGIVATFGIGLFLACRAMERAYKLPASQPWESKYEELVAKTKRRRIMKNAVKYLIFVGPAGVAGWFANDIVREVLAERAAIVAEKAEKDARAQQWVAQMASDVAALNRETETTRRHFLDLEARVKQVEAKTKDAPAQ